MNKDVSDAFEKKLTEVKPTTLEDAAREGLGKRVEAYGGGKALLPTDKSLPQEGRELEIGAITPENLMEIATNPGLLSRLESAGFHVSDAVKILTGERSTKAKLISIPYRIGRLYPEFRLLFNAVQRRNLEANEMTNKVERDFDKTVKKMLKKDIKLVRAVLTGQERTETVYELQPEGLLDLGLADKSEIDNYNEFNNILPKKQAGITSKGIEYLDKNVYEGLLDIAAKLGVTHKRVFKAGRAKLGYAVEETSQVVTQYATELNVLAHELGHQLDFKFNLWDKIVDKASTAKHPTLVPGEPMKPLKTIIQRELRDLSDLTWEGLDVKPYVKAKARTKAEKMAHILEAYIHARDRFKETAPNVLAAFENFIADTPQLKLLPSIRQGLVLAKNDIYISGNLSNIVRDYLKEGGTEKVVMDYLNLRDLLRERRLTAKEWGTDKVSPVKQNGWAYSPAELKKMGVDETAYNKIQQTIEFTTDKLVEKIKVDRDYYDAETTEIEKKIMDIEINEAVRKYGAYIQIMRFGDYGLEYFIDGKRHFSTYDTKSEVLEAVKQFEKLGASEITEIDMKDIRQRRRTYPYLSLAQLDAQLDKAEISKNADEIKELRDILKARMGNTGLIHREFVPGFERTGEHVIKTIETMVNNSIRGYTRAVINKEANSHIANIQNTHLQAYAQRYLDELNSGINDAAVFRGARQVASLWYLGAKPTYIIQSFFSVLRTLNRLHADEGFAQGSLTFAEAQVHTGQYLTYRMALQAGKFLRKDIDFKAGLDPEYVKLMDRLLEMDFIRANFVRNLLSIQDGIRTKGKPMQIKDTVLSVISAPAAVVDMMTRMHAATSGYLDATRKKLNESDTFALMIDFVTDTQTVYDSYNFPVLIRELDTKLVGGAKTIHMFNQFPLDWAQQMSGFLRGAVSGKDRAVNTRGVLSSVGTLATVAGVKGLAYAALLGSVYTLLTGDDPWRELRELLQGKTPDLTEINKATGLKLTKQDIADIAIYGILSKATEKDVSGILGLGHFPLGLVIREGEVEIHTAIGGLVERGRWAWTYKELGETKRMLAELSPDVLRNWQTGYRWEEKGVVTTRRGVAVKLGTEVVKPTEREIFWRKVGLSPLRLSAAYEQMFSELLLTRKRNEYAGYFYDKMALAELSEDEKRIERVIKELEEHNEQYPEMQITLDRRTLNDRIDKMEQGKSLKRTPKNIREELIRIREEVYQQPHD